MNTTRLPSPLPSPGTAEFDPTQVALRRLQQVRKPPVWLRPLRGLLDLIYLSAQRLRYHAGLSLLSLLGVILAIALVSSAAFFSNAVDTVIMRQELAEYSRVTGRPPLSSRIYSPSSRVVPLTLERTEALGENVAATLSAEVGLPARSVGMMADSGVLNLQPLADDARYAGKRSLGNVNVVYFRDIVEHVHFDGPPLDDQASGERLEVWMSAALGAKLGLQRGDQFDLTGSQNGIPIPIVVAGFWEANDVKDPFWFSDPTQTLADKLLVRRSDYIGHVEARLEPKVRSVTWYVILDDAQATPTRGRNYIEGFQNAAVVINKYLPEARLTSPSVSLGRFVGRQTVLTTLLLGFNIPALGFLLYFLIVTSAVIAYWQRRETAIMISRGMTRWGVLSYVLVEGFVLFLIGAPLGLGLGMLLARLMGYTVSFLDFRERAALPVSLDGLNLPLIGITMGVLLLAKLWTAAAGSRETVLTQQREHARPPQGPFWYRAYLDLILLIPAWYGYQQLSQRGSLGALVENRPEELYQDPLLIVVPALFVVVMAFLAMRLFPWIMRLLDWLANRTPWLTPHLALRQLGRYSQNYINPMLLVIVSLALGVYTLSMAASLDKWLVDRMYYSVGTDLTFAPYSETEAMSQTPTVGAEWIPPIDEFETLPGAISAARVGDYRAEIAFAAESGGRIRGRFLGVDRVDFMQVAWFRGDLARESLGALMNRLAATDDGILISEKLLTERNLQVGDKVNIHVITDFGTSVNTAFTIVGAYEYFPTVYDDQIAVVGNLEFLFSFFGMVMPHRVWVKMQPAVEGQTFLEAVPTLGITTIERKDTRTIIQTEQAKMERVGVFGTLSVGFIAATFMAALGLLTYSYASMNERLYLFSVMRSIGLNRGQVVGQVALEYTVLTAYGAMAGVIAGSTVATLFVPLFRVTGDLGTALPPLLPILARDEIFPLAIAFAGVMIVLEIVVISSALYQKLFSALRLGHQ
ncbi:MAG: ABC transporter permease [Caldilineaceae bacterium]|nr:ABC transporter permease [Caldilineaceae bacterium]